MADLDLSQNVNSFGLDIYKKLAETPGNVFFSPISISFALGMTSLGAKGNTLREMLTTMKIHQRDEEFLHLWFKKIKASLFSSEENYILTLANRLFGEKSSSILEKFLQAALENYDAKMETLDFKFVLFE